MFMGIFMSQCMINCTPFKRWALARGDSCPPSVHTMRYFIETWWVLSINFLNVEDEPHARLSLVGTSKRAFTPLMYSTWHTSNFGLPMGRGAMRLPLGSKLHHFFPPFSLSFCLGEDEVYVNIHIMKGATKVVCIELSNSEDEISGWGPTNVEKRPLVTMAPVKVQDFRKHKQSFWSNL